MVFKPGQKVICLRNYPWDPNYPRNPYFNYIPQQFTEGKIYTVKSSDEIDTLVEFDDRGTVNEWCGTKYFIDATAYLHEQAFNKTWNEMMESE
jgi:hypothetical protein